MNQILANFCQESCWVECEPFIFSWLLRFSNRLSRCKCQDDPKHGNLCLRTISYSVPQPSRNAWQSWANEHSSAICWYCRSPWASMVSLTDAEQKIDGQLCVGQVLFRRRPFFKQELWIPKMNVNDERKAFHFLGTKLSINIIAMGCQESRTCTYVVCILSICIHSPNLVFSKQTFGKRILIPGMGTGNTTEHCPDFRVGYLQRKWKREKMMPFPSFLFLPSSHV